ncbi:piezo-type mechanosensitive ion channel component 1-like [Convolutriloba macropyga]|uniref:piezo-type mechanosensitive ion channel component 1-like n=1 Tax=Convolutriloba macropyga TaxID=536237 RepID=UPI003F52735D
MEEDLTVITFNERVFPQSVSFLAGYGIIGLYLSLVLVIGKFVRMFVSDISYKIPFDELPNVDKVLKLCLDIYLCREVKEFALEEDLFAKLMYIYRSPEMLINFTKLKLD